MSADRSRSLGRRTFLKTTGAAGAATALGGLAGADDGDGSSRELLVGVSAATDLSTVESDVPPEVEVVDRDETLRYLRVRVPATSVYARTRIEAAIATHPGVRYTEPNGRLYPHGAPDDPKFDEQYAPQQVNAPAAWESDGLPDEQEVTVAIVDQGVMYDHPDLADRFGELKGKDFVSEEDDDPYPNDPAGEYHGTHVAGIAAATTDNAEGVAGISDARLLSCRVLSEYGGDYADVASGIRWAADQGADLINMSLGGSHSDTVHQAIQYATNNGTLCLASAGNDGSDTVGHPAAHDEVVSVAALDESEALASFSQYGENLDVAGPGVEVLSCWTEDDARYNRISGTSMSCPAATGVAALGKATHPSMGPDRLRTLLTDTARDVGLPERKQGAGCVDAENIVDAGGGGGGNRPPRPSVVVDDATVDPGTTVHFDASDSTDPDGTITSYEWTLGDGTTAIGESVSHSYDEPGEYTAELVVVDDEGASATETTTVTVEDDGGDGGGGGDCGDATRRTVETDTLSGDDDSATYTYATRTSGPCDVDLELDAVDDTDYDLYVTYDGREPTVDDYDARSWEYGSEEQISVGHHHLDDDTELGVLVDSYSGSGRFTLTIRESGRRAGDGGDGGDGGDDDCGTTVEVDDRDGWIRGRNTAGDTYDYAATLDDPCRLVVLLDGPDDADFDLYLTLDGTEPTNNDYDKRSNTQDSQERIEVDGVDPDQEFGILVYPYDGTGDYTVTVKELGR